MSLHINAINGDFSEVVLMPGDPHRAKYISEKYLTSSILVSNMRSMLGYTGYYKDKKVSILSHGIGIPSCSIYIYELVKEFDVKKIIRIGTCGTLSSMVKLRNIIVSIGACTDSQVNRSRFNGQDLSAIADFNMLLNVVHLSKKLNIEILVGNLFSTDLFYSSRDNSRWNLINKFNILGIDMETAGIYGLSLELGIKSLSLCTVSDHLMTNERISYQDRESTLDNMILLALESTLMDC